MGREDERATSFLTQDSAEFAQHRHSKGFRKLISWTRGKKKLKMRYSNPTLQIWWACQGIQQSSHHSNSRCLVRLPPWSL